jgi:hypothetical protein
LFSGLMANYFVEGANEVAVFEVEGSGDQTTLHPVTDTVTVTG